MDITRIKRGKIITVLLFLCVFFFLPANVFASRLYFEPTYSVINIGEIVNIDLMVEADAAGFSLISFEIDSAEYQPYLQLVDSSVQWSTAFNAYIDALDPTVAGDIIRYYTEYPWGDVAVNVQKNFTPLLQYSGSILSMSFLATNTGTAFLTYEGDYSFNSWEVYSPAHFEGNDYVPGEFTHGSEGFELCEIIVTSAAVPEPTTMLLFGAGLVALIGSRIRKKKQL